MISDQELSLIRDKLPSDCRYFIAGGSLLPGYHSDIDIYFYTEQDYLMARSILGPEVYSTSNAATYNLEYNNTSNVWAIATTTTTVQLVHRSFGTPHEILSDFDLNKSRQALLLDGTLYQHPTFHDDLYFDLDNFRGNTIQRLLKYTYAKEQPLDIPKLQSNLNYLLHQPLDTEYGHYYLVNEHLNCTILDILNKTFCGNLVFFSIFKPVIESLPTDLRLDIYNQLISIHTEMLPTEGMSTEFNLFAYIRNKYLYINLINHYPDLQIPERKLYQSVIDTYPEYLI